MKKRLDVLVYEKGFCESREKAKAIIMSGIVYVDNQKADKCGTQYDEKCNIDTILAFKIPECRAFMHLDTVFTQIDIDKFTYHPGIMDTLEVFEITKNEDNLDEVRVIKKEGSLENILEEYLQSFQGAIIFVSHDRYFVDKIAKRLYIFEGDGKIVESHKSFSEYLEIQSELKEYKKS